MAQSEGIGETQPRIASRQRHHLNIHAQSCMDGKKKGRRKMKEKD